MTQTNTSWTLPGIIDRRPMLSINAFYGDGLSCDSDSEYPDDVEQRTQCWWRGRNGVLEFVQRIEDAFDTGYRRIFINRPVGSKAGNRLIPSTFWNALTDPKQTRFEDILTPYLQRIDRDKIELGAYLGFRLNSDSSSIDMTPESSLRVPDLTKKSDIEWYADTIQGALNYQFNFFILDTAGDPNNQKAFYDLASAFWARGIKLIGEPIPKISSVSDGTTFRLPDPDATVKGHWIVYEQNLGDGAIADSWDQWVVDPDTTECHLILQGGTDSGVDLSEDTSEARNFIRDWVERGWIVSTGDMGKWFTTYISDTYIDSDGTTFPR